MESWGGLQRETRARHARHQTNAAVLLACESPSACAEAFFVPSERSLSYCGVCVEQPRHVFGHVSACLCPCVEGFSFAHAAVGHALQHKMFGGGHFICRAAEGRSGPRFTAAKGVVVSSAECVWGD